MANRKRSALVRVGLAVFLLAPLAAQADALPSPVAAALARQGTAPNGLSLYVHVVGDAEPALAFHADEPRNPASTLKLVTTLAALEELGPAYTWRTEVYARGPVRNGRLDGDLYIKGYGDPYLVIEQFWRLLRAVRQTGIETIAGRLVLDQSYFAPEAQDPGEFDGQPRRAYNVLPQALLVNFQTVSIRLIPQATGMRLVADPPVSIDNRMRLKNGPCRGAGWSFRVVGTSRLRFAGDYAASCGEYEMFRVLKEPGPYIYGLFRTLWSELGGKLVGGWREGAVPADARLIHTFYSPPLADVVRSINKYSNNVMTRQLLLTLGAERSGAPATTEKGRQAVRAWLERSTLSFPELVMDNGAGLSRDARITARSLGRLLLAADASPYQPEFVSALPVSGQDGTLKHRFGGPLAGRMHLKTGSLNGVRSLAGYVRDAAGRRVVVVYLHNDAQANTAANEAFQETLLEWVYRRPLAATVRATAPE